MDLDRDKRIMAVFKQAVELPESQRDLFVHEQCGNDPSMITLVRGLLQSSGTDAGFLSFPLAGMTEQAETRIGEQFGPYQLIRELGFGGMGSVYLAERNDGAHRRQVAVKLLHGRQHPHLRARFETEQQIMASLSHPNIARLYDSGTTEHGEAYLVMEYIDGPTLLEF